MRLKRIMAVSLAAVFACLLFALNVRAWSPPWPADPSSNAIWVAAALRLGAAALAVFAATLGYYFARVEGLLPARGGIQP